MKDEDFAYEQWRQRQIDNDRLTPRPYLIIGGALPQGERIQKSVRTDPHPEVPFTVEPCRMQPWEKIAWAILGGFFMTLVLILNNPFGWSW